MILDALFGTADDQPADENGRITEKGFPVNEQLEKEKEYKQGESNGKDASDPTAQRNMAPNGYTQRTDQQDQLGNLHIGGSETSPQGATTAEHRDVTAQGPGLEKEGSELLGNETRMQDQEFGASKPGTPAPDGGRAPD